MLKVLLNGFKLFFKISYFLFFFKDSRKLVLAASCDNPSGVTISPSEVTKKALSFLASSGILTGKGRSSGIITFPKELFGQGFNSGFTGILDSRKGLIPPFFFPFGRPGTPGNLGQKRRIKGRFLSRRIFPFPLRKRIWRIHWPLDFFILFEVIGILLGRKHLPKATGL